MFKNATVSVMQNESKEGIVSCFYEETSDNYGTINTIRKFCKKIQYHLADIGLVPIVDKEYVVK